MPVPVVVEFVAGTAGLLAGIGKARTEMEALTTASSTSAARVAAAGTAMSAVVVAGAAIVAVKAIEMAGDFQSAVTHLTTDAGEAKSNMQMVSDGILGIARETGSGTKDLINAMYYIESSGQHGAQALDTLHAAAEGAKVGNADLTTVANALSTVMSGYGDKAGTATQVTDQLVTAVSLGKTKLEDLSGAMATVLPAANTAGIGLDQVLGAMATMTSQGQDAATSATYLRQTILQLENPTAKARNEMKGLGLDSLDVSTNLGKRGLTGTFDVLTDAVAKHTEGGAVLIANLKASASNTTAFQSVLANLPPTQQTVVAALANMVGGTKSMQAALELTGSQAGKFKDDVAAIGASAKNTSSDVQDWDVIQGTFNQKMSELKSVVETAMISIGQKLLPVVSAMADKFLQFTSWLGEHKAVLAALAITVGVVLVAAFITAGVALYGLMAPFLVAMAPILAVVAGVALLAAGLVYLYNNVQPVHDAVQALIGTFHVFTDAFNADPSAPFWDRIKAGVEAFWPVFKSAMAQLGTALWTWIEDNKQPMLDKLKDWGSAIMDWIANTGAPWLGQKLGDLGKALIDWIAPRIPDILAELANMGGQIIWWIATTLVPDLQQAALTVGWDIVQGIAQGIWNAPGAIDNALIGVARGALSSIGSFLGINSPSLVFSRQIGSPISEGIAHGIANSGHMIDGALAAATAPRDFALSTAAFSAGGGPGGTFGTSGVGGAGGGDTHFHFTFSGPVYGGPNGVQQMAADVRTELLRTKGRNGSVGLA